MAKTQSDEAVDLEKRLEIVEQENDVLRERIAELELALMGPCLFPLEWRLTSSERKVLGVIVERELATKSAIMAALYHDIGRDQAEPKIADVFVCKIRKKVAPFGVRIETVWGEGWQIHADQRARIAAGEVDLRTEAVA